MIRALVCATMVLSAGPALAQRPFRLSIPPIPDSTIRNECGEFLTRGTPSIQRQRGKGAPNAHSGYVIIRVMEGWEPFTPLDASAIDLVSPGQRRHVVAGTWYTDSLGWLTTPAIKPDSVWLRVRRIGYVAQFFPIRIAAGSRDTILVTMRTASNCLTQRVRKDRPPAV